MVVVGHMDCELGARKKQWDALQDKLKQKSGCLWSP